MKLVEIDDLRKRIEPNNIELSPGYRQTHEIILEIIRHLSEIRSRLASLEGSVE